MRLKRLMSLVLAMALALSLVTVNAATQLIMSDDLSSYTGADEETAGTAFTNAMGGKSNQTWIATLKEEGITSRWYKREDTNYWPSGKITTNQAGSRAWLGYNALAAAQSKSYGFYYLYTDGFDVAAAENANKTVVFSFEADYGTDSAYAATSTPEYPLHLLFASADKATYANMTVFSLGIPNAETKARGLTITTKGSGASGNANVTGSAPNTTYKIAVGVGAGANTAGTTAAEVLKKTYGVNGRADFDATGKSNVSSGIDNNYPVAATVFHGFKAAPRFDSGLKLANFKMYVIDTPFAVSASKTAGLRGNETITFNFTNPVSEEAFEANKAGITVKEGDDEFTGFEVDDLVTTVANGQINSSVTIRFEGLKDSETYTVEFPAGITNEIAQPLNNSTVTLATVVPDLKVGSFTVISGWGSDDEAVVSDFTAEATLQGGKLEVANNTSENKDVAVIYAVYGHNGQLADMVYVQDVLKANGTSEIQAGVTLSENLTEGASTGKVKAFIWNTIDALTPYLGATERNIVAAQ